MNWGGKAGDSALVPPASFCQCTVCLQSSLLDFLLPTTLASTDPQGATFLPICSAQSLVQPWPKGAERSASSLQQAHPASLCSTFSAAEFSCNFLGTVRSSAQKSALGTERQDTLRAGGSHGLWRSWCPALELPAGWAVCVPHLATWLLRCC